MAVGMSHRALNNMPRWFRQYRCQIDKGGLKAQSSSVMRAVNRSILADLRNGAVDPEDVMMPVRSRDVSDRWAFD